MIIRKIADGGGGIAYLAVQAEEDIYARLDWAGYDGLRTEVGYSLTVDGIILIVEGDENLGGLAEMLVGASLGRRNLPTKNTKSTRGCNWTVRQFPVHFLCSQERRKK